MKHIPTTLVAGLLLGAATTHGLTLEVQKFDNSGSVPAGYQDVSDGIEAAEVINVSTDPFVDYLIPSNSGSAGITAAKFGGSYITESTAPDLPGGANSLIDPDKYQVVYTWDDGDPLPFGSDYYGVSWGGWSASETVTMTTRIDLVTDEEVTVYHWFNDGWNYADGGHDTLTGHNLTVTHYNGSGGVIAEETVTLPSGGAEDIFGDHRQFYASIMTATRTAAGDYLVITNLGANVGYKGTAVALLGGGGEQTWNGYPLRPDGYVDTTPWMGFVYAGNAEAKWVWNINLAKWVYVNDDSGWVYLPK
ncbi:MAG: hypothetical protein ACP5I4_13065 [Oceanipulchritudo sp.]